MENTNVPASQYLRASDVARILHVGTRTVARWADEGRIPYHKTLGGHRRYDPKVIAGVAERANHEVRP